MIQDPLLLLAFMLTVVAFARWLEERYEWVKKISSAVVCTLLGIVLANLGVIGHTGPLHDAVFTFAIPYAIVLVIMGTDMKELTNAGRPILIAYGAACLGSLVGGIAAGVMMSGLVGPEKILFATDFPLIKHRRAIAQVEEAIPAGNDRDAILGGNAARLFGL